MKRNQKRREKYRNMSSEEKSAFLDKKRQAMRERKEKREAFWATGTRSAQDDLAEFKKRRAEACMKYRVKKKIESSGQTVTRNALRSLLNVTPPQESLTSTPTKRRKDMTKEERRKHDAEVKRKWESSKSRQVS